MSVVYARHKSVDLMGPSPDASEALIGKILATCGEHRLVDRVTAQGENELEVCWSPPPEGPWYRTDGQGRRLLLPGTITTELAVQASELLIYATEGGRRPEDGVPVLGRITKARFLGPVPPGCTLFARVRLSERLGPAFYVDAEVRTASARVMSARLTFTATHAMTRWLESSGPLASSLS